MAKSVFANRVYDYCTGKDLLVGVSCIVAGLSGGPDSVALVSALKEIYDNEKGFPKIVAVHVNHGLRESASDDEQLAVRLCDKLGIPCKVVRFDVKAEARKMGRGFEETGRILRYRAFDEYAAETAEAMGIDPVSIRIATAHHKGDLTETFLMNLFRGSGLEGLTAMSSDPRIIRPLLEVSKSEILEYLEENNTEYAIDETNLESDLTRNRWRNDILPAIAGVSVKTPEDAVADAYGLLARDADYIRGVVEDAYGKCLVKEGKCLMLKTSEVLGLHSAIGTRVVRRLWQDTFGNLTDFESKHTDIVMGLMELTDGTKSADLAFGRTAAVCNGLLGFYEGDGTALACAMAVNAGFPAVPGDFEYRISIEDLEEGSKTLKLPDSDLVIEASVVENSEPMVYNTFSWICPAKDLIIGLCPADGDFRKAGSPHQNRIRKLMSDLKVPKDAREHLLAVKSGEKILWIPGIGHEEGFISSESRRNWLKEEGNASVKKLIRLDILNEGETDETL